MKAESLLDLIQKIKLFRFILSDLILKKNQSETQLIFIIVTGKNIYRMDGILYNEKYAVANGFRTFSASHRPSGILRKHQIRFTIINPIKTWKKGLQRIKTEPK